MKLIVLSSILILGASSLLGQDIELAVPRNHTSRVSGLSLSSDGKLLLTASDDRTVILREVSSANYLRTYEINKPISDVKFLADNNHFLVKTDSGIVLHETGKKQSLQFIKGQFYFIRSNRRHNEFATLDENGALAIYKFIDKQFRRHITVDSIRQNERSFFSYSGDGRKLIYFKGKAIKSFDITTGKIESITITDLPDSSICSMALHSDNKTLAIGMRDGSIDMYDLSMKKIHGTLRAYTAYWKGVMYKGIVKDSTSLKDPVRDLEFLDAQTLTSYHSPYKTGFYPDEVLKPARNRQFVDSEDLDKMWDQLDVELNRDENDPLQTKDLFGTRPTLLMWNLQTKKTTYLSSTSDPIAAHIDWVVTPGTILNLKSGETVSVHLFNTSVSEAHFSTNGKSLLLNKDYKSCILDLSTGKTDPLAYSLMTSEFKMHKNFLGVKAEGGYFNLGLFDIDSKKISRTVSDLDGDQYFLNPAKEQIAYRTLHDDTILVTDFTKKKLLSYNGTDAVYHQFSLDGEIFVLSDYRNTFFYETDHFNLIDSLPRYQEEWHERVDKIIALRNLVFFTSGGDIMIRDIARKQTIDTIKRESFYSIAVSPTADLVVTGSNDGQVTFLDLKTKTSKVVMAHEEIVKAIDFNPDGRLMISTGQDGLIKFWDVSTQTVLGQLLFYEDDWVVVSKDGLFDGSAGGLAKLFFINGLQTIELSQLKDRFYEPGLLSKLVGISKEQLRKSQGLHNIRMFPKIDINSPDEKGVLIANITNQGGGIGRVKIFINGKEAMADARGTVASANKEKIAVTLALSGHPFLKPNEVNLIEVKAYNEDEYLESPAKKVYYFAPGQSETTINLYAVVIGTSDYNGTQLDLKYAAKDAEQFGFALTEESSKLFGKDHVSIEMLTTGSKEKWPTKANIKKAFIELSKRAKPNDILIVYLAGHGLNYGNEESDFYYLTADAQSGNLQDPVVRGEVAISSHEFTEYIKMVPALKQIMILDACHSGKFAEDLLAKREAKSAGEIRALERMKDRTGMFILSGSAADAVSYEASSFGQGLLTYSLLLGMKGAALRDKQYLDVMGLFQYSVDMVPQLAQNIGGIQKPELRVPYAAESYDIGMLDEEISKKIVLPTPKPVFIRSVFQDEDTFGDPIGLSDQIDVQLKTSEGEKTNIIFIDAMKYADGYTLRGRYKKTNGTYDVIFKLLKGDVAVKDFRASGNNADELAKKIIKMSTESIR